MSPPPPRPPAERFGSRPLQVGGWGVRKKHTWREGIFFPIFSFLLPEIFTMCCEERGRGLAPMNIP